MGDEEKRETREVRGDEGQEVSWNVAERPIDSIIEKPKVDLSESANDPDKLKRQAKAAVDYGATVRAVQDEQFVQSLADLKKKELETGAESSLKKEQVESKKTDKELQIAEFGTYEGIAELIGLKKELPKPTLHILMWILQPFLIVFWVVFGLVTGIVNIVMDSVNAITKRFAEFTAPAKKILVFLMWAALAAAALLVIYWLLHRFGIISF